MKHFLRLSLAAGAMAAALFSTATLARPVSMESCMAEIVSLGGGNRCVAYYVSSTASEVVCGAANGYSHDVQFDVSWTKTGGWACNRHTISEDVRDFLRWLF